MPPLALILRHWKLALAGVLLLAVAVQTVRVERLKAIVERLTGQNKALRHSLDEIKAATAIADKRAREAKAAAEAEYRAKAERTDLAYKANLADARARAARYADANRVRYKAADRQTGGTSPAAPDSSAGSADQAGDDSGVVVTRGDFDALVDNTLRLKAAREWACSLEGAKC